MKKIYFILLSAELLFGGSLFASASNIHLSGRKDRVLTSEVRLLVLGVAEECLKREDRNFIASTEGLKSPYSFKEVVVVSRGAPASVEAPDEIVEVPVVYDDASVLRVVGGSFAKQVRGTLARGTIHYLQIQGGGMIKSGSSFPAKIAELKGQSFTVTIIDINSSGYTLKLKDATLTFPFDDSSGVSSSATRNSSP